MKSDIKIRSARPDDISLIYAFIQKKSEFDRFLGAYSGTTQTSEEKIRQTIFNPHPFAHVLFAEKTQAVMGFALYYFRYSSFVGQPSIWLDDLYLDETMRSQGAGALLMAHLQQIAQENNCTHIAWIADARNTRGLEFYYRLGAKIIQQQANRCFFQWNLSAIY